MSLGDVAIVSVKGNDYRTQFCYMSKDEAIRLFEKMLIMNIFDLAKTV